MVDYDWPRVETEINDPKRSTFRFYIDPGSPGGQPGGSRTDPRAEKKIKKLILI